MSQGQWPRTYPKPQLYKKHGSNKSSTNHFTLKTKKTHELNNILNKNSSRFLSLSFPKSCQSVFYNSPTAVEPHPHFIPANNAGTLAICCSSSSCAAFRPTSSGWPFTLLQRRMDFAMISRGFMMGKDTQTGSQKNLRILGVDFGTCALFFHFYLMICTCFVLDR